MAAYTILNEGVINAILENYNIAPVRNFEVLGGGSENTNYFVESDDGKFVLTICENKTLEHSRALATLLEHLMENGFHTSKVIRDKDGECISTLNGKPIMLKGFLDGKVLEAFDLDMTRKLGQQIGRLHQIKPLTHLPELNNIFPKMFRHSSPKHSSIAIYFVIM